jgi:hypothetical protein
MDSGSDHFDGYGSPTPMQCTSQHPEDTLLAPRLRHLCLDLFVPVYKVTPGDRYHSLVTRFLHFRASLRDEKTGRPALRRLTLQGWSDQGLAEVVASYACNDIIIDANMSGGAYFLCLCILRLFPEGVVCACIGLLPRSVE